MKKEFESPERTVYASVEQFARRYLWRAMPDLWEPIIGIRADVDINADMLDIDVELTSVSIGVAYEVKDITRKILWGEYDTIKSELDYVLREFSERTFIKVKTE
jgi:hypothetical protein